MGGYQATWPTRRRAGSAPSGSGCQPQPHPRGGGVLLDVDLRQHPLMAECGAEPGGQDRPHWAGSLAASSPTGPRPNGAFALAEQLGSVNAAAAELRTTWPSLRKAFARHGLGMRPATRRPSAAGHRRRPPAQRPGRTAGPGLGDCGAQPRRPASPPTACGRAVCVGPPRRGVRHLGRQRGGRAEQREPPRRSTTRAWAIIRRADRTSRPYQEREMVADGR
jgi:hypothetical protein